jgi:hypothetical protein
MDKRKLTEIVNSIVLFLVYELNAERKSVNYFASSLEEKQTAKKLSKL